MSAFILATRLTSSQSSTAAYLMAILLRNSSLAWEIRRDCSSGLTWGGLGATHAARLAMSASVGCLVLGVALFIARVLPCACVVANESELRRAFEVTLA